MRAAYMAPAKTVDWRTPPEVVELVREALGGRITLDPCASDSCPAEELLAHTNLRALQDGLAQPWFGAVYVNPPFSDNAKWVAKCVEEHRSGRAKEIVLLIPARTDTRYWQDGVATADSILFWRGRMRFVGASASAPFPVALAYWGPFPSGFESAFAGKGQFVMTRPTVLRRAAQQRPHFVVRRAR